MSHGFCTVLLRATTALIVPLGISEAERLVLVVAWTHLRLALHDSGPRTLWTRFSCTVGLKRLKQEYKISDIGNVFAGRLVLLLESVCPPPKSSSNKFCSAKTTIIAQPYSCFSAIRPIVLGRSFTQALRFGQE
jgi:hypothetical protein